MSATGQSEFLFSSPVKLSAAQARRTLLVVDDEEGPRQSLRVIFRDSYNVLVAEDGMRALELARTNHVDAAVLDIRMAGISGIDVLRELKELNPEIQVVLLTAYETVETARQALRLGACDYLSKPFDLPTITAAVQNAMDRQSLTDEVRSNARKLKELQEELQNHRMHAASLRERGEIYASLIHDINGPLTIISGFMQIINQRIGDNTRVDGEALDLVKERLARITRQVNNCIEISRRYLSFLREKSSYTPSVRVNQVLSDVEDLIASHPSMGANQLVVKQLPFDIQVSINGTDLLQIILNLTINALQCMTGTHRVTVAGEVLSVPDGLGRFAEGPCDLFIGQDRVQRGVWVAVSVQDDGPGISADIVPRIFEPFFTTKGHAQGTGLGLAIVKRLIGQAGGGLHLHTRQGGGTTFTVFLKIHGTNTHPSR